MTTPKPWIKSTTQLPTDKQPVWAWRCGDDGKWKVVEGVFNAGACRFWCQLLSYSIKQVPYWMPRFVEAAPLPPEGE